MTEVVEEFFIRDSDSDSDEVASIPKRYATRSKTITKNKLIKENLNQIVENNNKEIFSNKLEEKIHYLQLDLANKELELIELNHTLEHQNKIVNQINCFETCFKIMEENMIKYKEIIIMLEKKSHVNYLEGVQMYIEVSKNSLPNFTYESNILPEHVQFILVKLYEQMLVEDYNMKEKVKIIVLDYNANYYKHILHTVLIAAFIMIVLFGLYVYWNW